MTITNKMPMLQGKQCHGKRVQNAAATIGVPLMVWGRDCGDGRHRGPAGWWEEARETDKGQRQGLRLAAQGSQQQRGLAVSQAKCILGFSSYNSLTHRRLKKHSSKKHLKILTDWFLMGGRAMKIPMITECI